MMHVGRGIAVALLLAPLLVPLLVTAGAPAAWGQGATVGAGDAPIEVFSDDGIEWRRDENMYIARGNAVAIQDEDRVRGDVLVAHYRETADGGTEIWRMEARGNARIETPGQTVTGATAVYEVDTGILVVRGGPLRMETESETVTASESLEYWSGERMAVARGDARVVRANGDTVDADVLTGYFANDDADPGTGDADQGDAPGGHGLERMEAFGGVIITTAQEVVRGDRAVYDVAAGVATVDGDVTISTETDQFAGERAVMDLNTGVSTLRGGGDDDSRARALIAPQRPDNGADDDAPEAESGAD
ncbi:hypothetical protein [uncultured Rhodospira sp.]|uniref:LptA/OstA family protein n=1 Tax=uncultured Rhodospira sp. TaxID=1936189 RepID=UPI00260D68F5|nr:hypothetical protein [uncultured Rhodospira sp.]